MKQEFTRGYNNGAESPIVHIEYDDEEYVGVISVSNRPDMRLSVEQDTIILVSHFQPYGSSFLIQGKQYHYSFIDEPTNLTNNNCKFYDEVLDWTFVRASCISTVDINNHPFVTGTTFINDGIELTKKFPFVAKQRNEFDVPVVPVGWYQKPYQTDVEMIPTSGFSIRILQKTDELRDILGQ